MEITFSDPTTQGLHEVRRLVKDQRQRLDALDIEIAKLKTDIEEIRRNGAGAGVTGG